MPWLKNLRAFSYEKIRTSLFICAGVAILWGIAIFVGGVHIFPGSQRASLVAGCSYGPNGINPSPNPSSPGQFITVQWGVPYPANQTHFYFYDCATGAYVADEADNNQCLNLSTNALTGYFYAAPTTTISYCARYAPSGSNVVSGTQRVVGGSVAAAPATVSPTGTSSVSWSTTGISPGTCSIVQGTPSGEVSTFSAMGAGDNGSKAAAATSTTGSYSYTLACDSPYTASANNGTLQNSPPTAAGIIGQAISLNGGSQYVSTAAQSTNPQIFSLSIWFKTTTPGGKLIGFESSKTGTGSGSFDRHLYLGNDGKVYFGWNPGASVTISSSAALNNGAWHLAVATFNSGSGALYIDGVLQGSLTTGPAQNYSGYWRLGSYKLSGWTNGSNGYFGGLLDDARIYNRVLAPSEVSALYALGNITAGLTDYWTFNTENISGLTAYNEAGGVITNTSYLTVFDPPAPTGVTYACNAAGTQATLAWSPSSGATAYPVRFNDPTNDSGSCQSGWFCAQPPDYKIDSNTAPSYTFSSLVPGRLYGAWVHAISQGVWSAPTPTTTLACTPQSMSISATPSTVPVAGAASISWDSAGVGALSCAVSRTDPGGTTSAFSVLAGGDSNAGKTTGALSQTGDYIYALSCAAPYLAGRNGTLTGTTAAAPGKLGGARSFGGAGQSVGRMTFPTLSLGTGYTLSMWIYPVPSSYSYGSLLTRGTNFGLWYMGSTHLVNFLHSGASHQNTTPLSENQWHLVTLVNSGSTATFYIDGVEDGTAAGISNVSFSSMGSDPYSFLPYFFYPYNFSGSIDDVRVYDRALSASEVSTLYNLGSVGDGLAAYWPFDTQDTPGSIAYDQAGGVITESTAVTVGVQNTLPNLSAPGTLEISSALSPSSARVRKGDSALITWDVEGLVPQNTCSLSSSPALGNLPQTWDQTGSVWSGGPLSLGPVQAQTTLTLTCVAPDGITTATVQKYIMLVPSVQEI